MLHQQDEPKQWEYGQNRLADLSLLTKTNIENGNDKPQSVKLHDTWNSFDLKFSIFYPSFNDNDEMIVRGLKFGQDLTMKRSNEAIPWCQNKYGENVKVFMGTMLMGNHDIKFASKNKGPQPVKYQY